VRRRALADTTLARRLVHQASDRLVGQVALDDLTLRTHPRAPVFVTPIADDRNTRRGRATNNARQLQHIPLTNLGGSTSETSESAHENLLFFLVLKGSVVQPDLLSQELAVFV
jgi:hypothetical protein